MIDPHPTSIVFSHRKNHNITKIRTKCPKSKNKVLAKKVETNLNKKKQKNKV
eukprot:UN23882